MSGRFIYGFSDKSELLIFNENDELLTRMRSNESRHKIPDADKKDSRGAN
jgi:hypothetical protein